MIVLKNFEPGLSYVLAEFFDLYLIESWSPNFWKVLSVVAIIKNIWETTATKNYHHDGLLFVVNEFFKKLVNNMLVDHLEKFGFFSDLQYGFRSTHSTAHLLTVVCDRIVRAFARCGATQAVVLDISKNFDRV